MPDLRVEYAKSGRSKCSNCKTAVDAGELRIGTATMMPGAEEKSYKWRHIPCFTKRQLVSCKSVDNIEGFDDLEERHQEIVRRMIKGDFVGNKSLIGKFLRAGAVAAVEEKEEKKTKAAAAAQRNKKNLPLHEMLAGVKHDRDHADGDGYGNESAGATLRARVYALEQRNAQLRRAILDSGDEVPDPPKELQELLTSIREKRLAAKRQAETLQRLSAVPVKNVAATIRGKPRCQYGKMCFRDDANHRRDFSHDTDLEDEEDAFGKKKQKQQNLLYRDESSDTEEYDMDDDDDDDDDESSDSDGERRIDFDNLNDIFGFAIDSPHPPVVAVAATGAGAGTTGKKFKTVCPLGAMCTRTNREHFDEFSHPNDIEDLADLLHGALKRNATAAAPSPGGKKKGGVMLQPTLNFGAAPAVATERAAKKPVAAAGAMPDCQWGANCYNRTPDHMNKFKHPFV